MVPDDRGEVEEDRDGETVKGQGILNDLILNYLTHHASRLRNIEYREWWLLLLIAITNVNILLLWGVLG